MPIKPNRLKRRWLNIQLARTEKKPPVMGGFCFKCNSHGVHLPILFSMCYPLIVASRHGAFPLSVTLSYCWGLFFCHGKNHLHLSSLAIDSITGSFMFLISPDSQRCAVALDICNLSASSETDISSSVLLPLILCLSPRSSNFHLPLY